MEKFGKMRENVIKWLMRKRNKENRMYKTEVIEYTPVAKKMAKKIEEKCNDMEQEGYALVSTTITLGAKAILVFKK